ncbi:MAG: hypothetical protein K0U74_07680 [Alphaproteobacteria bacterium]|nr:hypothetical protein [Alphaproteobacteria bacterium]
MIKLFNAAALALFLAAAAIVPLQSPTFAADNAAKPAQPTAQSTTKEYSEQGLLDAAYNFCATVQNRGAASCDCEQKLLKQPQRFGAEERLMAFYYFTDKERYLKEYKARIAADPKWQEDFSLRMAQMQALIIAACGA